MERIICLAIGYAFGLFQTAYIYGRMHGIDIRQHGSGNAGTTNALRVLGRKAGLVVFLGDVLKCAAAVAVCMLLFSRQNADRIYLLKMYAAAGAILGHNFPFYLGFKGGKGIAATAGLILSLHPYFLPVGAIVFFSVFLLTHYVSLGSLLVYAAFLIQVIICGQTGVFGTMTDAVRWEMYLLAAALTVMAYVKHAENIQRLLKGVERKTYLKKKEN